MEHRKGPWKEGRSGGISLCYLDLHADQLTAVAEHHAAVGIRATVICRTSSAPLAALVTRNWDLAATADASVEALADLATLDGRTERGFLQERPAESVPPGALYVLRPGADTVASPGVDLARPLPMLPSEGSLPAAQDAFEHVVSRGHWGLVQVTGEDLDRLTMDDHRRLLSWLGDHHARIWCAPVRDIATWRPS